MQYCITRSPLTSLKCRMVSRFCPWLAPLLSAAALEKMRRCRRARRAGGAAAHPPGRRQPCRGGDHRIFVLSCGQMQAASWAVQGQPARATRVRTAKAWPVVPLSAWDRLERINVLCRAHRLIPKSAVAALKVGDQNRGAAKPLPISDDCLWIHWIATTRPSPLCKRPDQNRATHAVGHRCALQYR